MSNDEFGPLIIHDGKTIPPVGTIVNAFFEGKIKRQIRGAEAQGENWAIGRIYKTSHQAGSWTWKKGYLRVVSYRIKKSDGFKLLEKLVSDPPTELIKGNQLETV